MSGATVSEAPAAHLSAASGMALLNALFAGLGPATAVFRVSLLRPCSYVRSPERDMLLAHCAEIIRDTAAGWHLAGDQQRATDLETLATRLIDVATAP